jgi:hypothetical protein
MISDASKINLKIRRIDIAEYNDMIIKWLSIKRKIAKVQIVHDYKEDE